jgi:hypothetical protein
MGGAPREEPRPISAEEQNYLFNSMIFEIAANWEFVSDLMSRFATGNLKTVDPLEKDWLNFSMGNGIVISNYANSDIFIETLFKK